MRKRMSREEISKHHYVPVKLLPSGLRAVSTLTKLENETLLKFGSGANVVTVATDDVLLGVTQHIRIPSPPRVAMKKAAKKASGYGRSSNSAERKRRRAISVVKETRRSPKGSVDWIRKFILKFFEELRAIICKRRSGAQSITENSAITGVASFIIRKFGVTADIAQAIATAIIFAIVTAGRNAFCSVTKEVLAQKLKSA